MMLPLFLMFCTAAETPAYSVEAFALGPVSPRTDLRNMVRRHIVRRCCEALNLAAAKRMAAFDSGAWEAWRTGIRERVSAALGDMPFGDAGGPLNVRAVSRHERRGYAIEDVLFESFPGVDVNASVYLPDVQQFPPPWPAIVVPVGHSGKQMESYQIPAQVFARCGYVAVTFDPPGMAGEKSQGNDHFGDGVRCYLTGASSNRYFVIDALRCIDYLATRPDVDLGRGVGMTGVSGGGTTTMFATALDGRIRAAGPTCCATPNALHPVLDAYAPCAETLACGRFEDGYDDTDLLAAAAPTPVLLMAGAADEVFRKPWSEQVARETSDAFAAAGAAERFRYFEDPGGHAYTVAMALEFARWMDRWIRETPDRALPALTRDDFEMDPPELLQCHPRLDGNMFATNRALAEALRAHRSGLSLREAVMSLCNAEAPLAAPRARAGERTQVWFHTLEELLLRVDADVGIPATFLAPQRADWKGTCVLYFDDRGRWTDLRGQGMLASLAGFTNPETDGPAILTADLRGWGDSAPADLPYEIAGWGAHSRWIAYVSAALGDPIFAMRVRDGLAALTYLRKRPETDPARLVVGGRGMGGAVALHVAAIDACVAGVFSIEGLATFESLAAEPDCAWSHEDFFPGVLRHYDLPELVRDLDIPALVVNPLDAKRAPLDRADAEALYSGAASRVETGIGPNALAGTLEGFVRGL